MSAYVDNWARRWADRHLPRERDREQFLGDRPAGEGARTEPHAANLLRFDLG